MKAAIFLAMAIAWTGAAPGQDQARGEWKAFKQGDRFTLHWTFEEKFRWANSGNEITRADRREVEGEMVAEKDGRDLKIVIKSATWTYSHRNTGAGSGYDLKLSLDGSGQVREDAVKWLTVQDFPKALEDLKRLKEDEKKKVMEVLQQCEAGNKRAAEAQVAQFKKYMTQPYAYSIVGFSRQRIASHAWATDSVNSLLDWAYFHDRTPADGFKDGGEWEQDLEPQEHPRSVSSIPVARDQEPRKIKMSCRASGQDLAGTGRLRWDYSRVLEANKAGTMPERKITAKHEVDRDWVFAGEGYLQSCKIGVRQSSRAVCDDDRFRQTIDMSWSQDLRIDK